MIATQLSIISVPHSHIQPPPHPSMWPHLPSLSPARWARSESVIISGPPVSQVWDLLEVGCWRTAARLHEQPGGRDPQRGERRTDVRWGQRRVGAEGGGWC